jgi:hypothetical protein
MTVQYVAKDHERTLGSCNESAVTCEAAKGVDAEGHPV